MGTWTYSFRPATKNGYHLPLKVPPVCASVVSLPHYAKQVCTVHCDPNMFVFLANAEEHSHHTDGGKLESASTDILF
jgi:hypothetical protein